ncbi:signal transduction histidine kinase%2C nitrogen specific [Mycobacterium tuberculosis]|nr:signal transduction histidine kinase%2C nitrogen specific [Mycobacterium tuberculosis]
MPYYELVDERPVLDAYHRKQPDEKYVQMIARRNRRSIDGLPGLEPDHPLPPR